MKGFFEKHSKGISIVCLALILFSITCVFYIYKTGTSISALNDITEQYKEITIEPVTEETTLSVETSVTTESQEINENEVSDLTKIQTEKQGLVNELSSLVNNFYASRTGLGASNDKNEVLQNTRPYITNNCYEHYMVPYYDKKDPLVKPKDWVIIGEIKYDYLETDTPKAIVFTEQGFIQRYSLLEFVEIDNKWYIDSMYDYIEQRTN